MTSDESTQKKAKEYLVTIGKNNSNASMDSVNQATPLQKTFGAILLIITTIFLVLAWVNCLKQIEKELQLEIKVSWEAPAHISLRPGPPSFWYDQSERSLYYTGIIDKKQKEELVALLKPEDKGISKKMLSSYWAAIDKMAYNSRKPLSRFIQDIIILGGISGCLGVQLRSLINFVGNACFKKTLDLLTWWPWYVIRPFSGFILGMVIVIIIQAGLFKPGETAPLSTLWWAGIALLAGFGADDFTLRLRLLTQTLFGQSSSGKQ